MTSPSKRWSYSTGERGRNRVRVFAHQDTGRLFLEFSDGGRKKRMALGHSDREAAKLKAEELAAKLRKPDQHLTAAPTLQTLFDIYLREVTPGKARSTQRHDHRAAALFIQCFGGGCKVETLNRRDWDRFIEWRRGQGDGRGGKVRGQPIRERIVTYDLKVLQAVLNWATTARDGSGRLFLERNPLKGAPWPKERAPRRPMLTEDQFQLLKSVSRAINPLFELALHLAHETGHRIGAILLLKWSDVLFDRKKIRWRAENDKIGLEQETEASEVAMNALEQARADRPAIGDVWVFPSPTDASKPCSRHLMRDWWQQGEQAAKLQHEPGRGWHSLRRKFATDLKHIPLVDLQHLGGWKDHQTILKCYQRADEATAREALASRAKRVEGGR